jgi:PHD/YefM family antitoxin component YafN of YafNO toxin-antitoxin module
MSRRVPEDMTLATFAPGEPLERVGHRELRDKLGPMLEKISASHSAVEVVNRGRSEAVVVSHDMYTVLLASQRELDDVRDSVALLLAAVAAGAAVPSDTLDRLGIIIPVDLDALQAFQATYPVRITHGEDGQRLGRTPVLSLESYADYVDEPDEFVDVDE